LPLDEAKRAAVAMLREKETKPRDRIAELNKIAAAEVHRAWMIQGRKHWPRDLVGAESRPGSMHIDGKLRDAILDAELLAMTSHAEPLSGDGFRLEFYDDSHPKLPAWLRGGEGGTASFAPLGASDSPFTSKCYRPNGTDRLTLAQADNLFEAVAFASQIGLHLRAHLTVMWSLTMAFDDHEGKRAALLREGLRKVLHRRGIPWCGAWVRECKPQTDVTHDHLLFHLPPELCTATAFQQLEVSIMRLVGLHGDGITHRDAVKLMLYLNGADGRYMLKGGGREVWEKYRLPSSWRRMQGRIYGKRCGTSQNLGPAARLQALIEQLCNKSVQS
jgi:hypothetical protein